MQKAFEKIFAALLSDLSHNIEYFKQSDLEDTAAGPRSSSSGSQEITFRLDDNGYYMQKFTKYGAGVTVRFKITILAPKANYSVIVESSDGGKAVFKNMTINHSRSGVIKTSFWHATTIVITIESTIKNTEVIARLDYSY